MTINQKAFLMTICSLIFVPVGVLAFFLVSLLPLAIGFVVILAAGGVVLFILIRSDLQKRARGERGEDLI